jgi:transposase
MPQYCQMIMQYRQYKTLNAAYSLDLAIDKQHIEAYLILRITEVAHGEVKRRDPKSGALAQDGVLNPNPEVVRDALFAGNPFFDANDLIQVRYEMVRRHQVDGLAITEAAAAFGVTRPTFYKAQSALKAVGLAGLLPSRRGPKDGHKVSTEVVAFAIELKTAKPEMTTSQCLDAIKSRFGVKVHRRSLERALARKKKRIHPA